MQGWLSQLCCAQLLEDQSPFTVTVVQKAPMQDVSTDKGECAAMVCQFMAHAALGAVGAGLPVEGWCTADEQYASGCSTSFGQHQRGPSNIFFKA